MFSVTLSCVQRALWRFALVLSLLLGSTAALSPAAVHAQSMPEDIVGTAVDAGNFTTLTKALTAAGLVDTLKGPGPYTVFAPTDDAFAKLPPGTLDQLLANPDALQAVLTYHVVPGRLTAADVAKLQTAATVEGEDVTISADDAGVHIDNASVTQPDVMASNGVIHAIDTVMLPPSLSAQIGAD